MARKVRSTANNFGKFVAADDTAIGGDEATRRDRYQKYLNTADLTLLELDMSKNPGFYYVRAFSSVELRKLADFFTHLKGENDQISLDVLENASAESKLFDSVRSEVLSACFVGCEDHPIPEKMISDKGFIEASHWKWEVGSEAPKGLIDAMVQDEVLVDSLLTYTMALSQLTEKEKN